MTVVFLKEYDDGGRIYRPGSVVKLPDSDALKLIGDGVAVERKWPGPTETKEDE